MGNCLPKKKHKDLNSRRKSGSPVTKQRSASPTRKTPCEWATPTGTTERQEAPVYSSPKETNREVFLHSVEPSDDVPSRNETKQNVVYLKEENEKNNDDVSSVSGDKQIQHRNESVICDEKIEVISTQTEASAAATKMADTKVGSTTKMSIRGIYTAVCEEMASMSASKNETVSVCLSSTVKQDVPNDSLANEKKLSFLEVAEKVNASKGRSEVQDNKVCEVVKPSPEETPQATKGEDDYDNDFDVDAVVEELLASPEPASEERADSEDDIDVDAAVEELLASLRESPEPYHLAGQEKVKRVHGGLAISFNQADCDLSRKSTKRVRFNDTVDVRIISPRDLSTLLQPDNDMEEQMRDAEAVHDGKDEDGKKTDSVFDEDELRMIEEIERNYAEY